ncbi:TetR/AcrR family transcriptional regulator [Paracoccus marinaquae]|uniref:TetR/AcrR family transcriptional regulator n=1 Tax=Paracoccus marinaquae TaxID=2841926 RepID=A0ABS6AGC7_9RHOB|nr:TetR/AcrR family transcriptional regulator [Paracoccus marinaquae]MBU3029640.1 TetR/AcrR family transcriptional regulator [Paracoccus marinaquae]
MLAKPKPNRGRKFEQVCNGARDVFLRDGYSGASVDDIARTAGVSKATLYSYFPEKGEMYREVLMDEIARVATQNPIRISPEASADEALPMMTRQIAAWLVSGPALQIHRSSVAEAARFPEVSRHYYTTVTAQLREVVQGHLDRWVAAGELSIEDTDLAADQLIRLSGALLHERALLTCTPGAREAAIRQISDSAARLFILAHRDRDSLPISSARQDGARRDKPSRAVGQ